MHAPTLHHQSSGTPVGQGTGPGWAFVRRLVIALGLILTVVSATPEFTEAMKLPVPDRAISISEKSEKKVTQKS